MNDRRRCDYLTGVTEVIADEAELLHADWAVSWEDGPAYRDMLAASDGSDGIDDLVNDGLFLLEAIADRELGAAAGLMDSPADADDARADHDEPPDLAVTDMRDHLRGLRAVLVGDGPDVGDGNRGLSPLLGKELSRRLDGLLDEADAALGILPPRLRTATARSPEAVEHARDAVKAVQIAVATEVVGRLGVAIGFSDADGDSSN